ncbi:MAG TPA: CDP-alcohol phosphatidyltransferase family protein [Steroidobacteraceae bacterium]|nr:CDP-alcohol phosphatidyltransferase family protein [Steroidobacteraceae bacterium]
MQRPWDARLARCLVRRLKDSRVTPNQLTTARLLVGLGAAAAFVPGTYGWSNAGAVLFAVSNFLDHSDGELARISGKSSRAGHIYDLASDAIVTILAFVAIGIGVGARTPVALPLPAAVLGSLAGCAIALIFFLRMRIEERLGKAGTVQASLGGFETEDVLYLLPLATLCDGTVPLLIASALCAPLYAVWVVFEYRRVMQRRQLRSIQNPG